MNSFQLLARMRRDRRFTQGDGVLVTQGPHKGRRGVVTSWRGALTGQESSRVYDIRFSDTSESEGADLASFMLTSDPAGNTGKYGGPTRYGAPGGWCGGNRYRTRR